MKDIQMDAVGTGEGTQAYGYSLADEMMKELPGRNEMNVYIEEGDEAIWMGWSDGSPVLVLDHLYIDPQNRGKGIGKQILKIKMDELSKRYPGMELKLLAEPLGDSIDTDNLVDYYESLGFTVADYEDGMSGVPMQITLPKK